MRIWGRLSKPGTFAGCKYAYQYEGVSCRVWWGGHSLILFSLTLTLLACSLSNFPFVNSGPIPTPTVILAQFRTPSPTSTLPPSPSPSPTSSPTATIPPTDTPTPTQTPTTESSSPPEPSLTPESSSSSPAPPTAVSPTDTPVPVPPAAEFDFVVRYVRLRTNEENSWDGTLGIGQCGSDHSIYVYVADAQENLLDDIFIGDRYGNFEVPTGVDGPGKVRILVWSATMELAVMGHQDGTRYTSQFTPPLSTLDEHIPLDWLQQAGYCDSPEDCQWRVENNQICRGHYSYDVIFQRTW